MEHAEQQQQLAEQQQQLAVATGTSAVLDGALGQLFRDLDKIPERDRSQYETALHRELLEVAQRLRPLSAPIMTINTLRYAIGQTVQVDLGPSDTTRNRCDQPNCPNKRK